MPIEVGIWRLGERLEKVSFSSIESESRLEDVLASNISILSPELMLLGRQIPTGHGKFIDLLAMDEEGNLSVIELKKNRTPREVVAQLLDYASGVQTLSYDDITRIYSENNKGKSLEKGFAESFDSDPPEKLNESLKLIVVAAELDSSTERIINYLTDNYGVPINAVFFRYFKDGKSEYLTRTWLIDPFKAEGKTAGPKGSEVWNGRDFYVTIGEGERRTWGDCVRYGFVSGGGGKWYSQTLNLLFPGSRVFVMVPKTGYVGVGIVKETSVPVRDFMVNLNGKPTPILEAPIKAPNLGKNADNLELSEYLVRVDWIKTVTTEQAYWEKGLFAKQHTACRLKNRFTIERLSEHFDLVSEP